MFITAVNHLRDVRDVRREIQAEEAGVVRFHWASGCKTRDPIDRRRERSSDPNNLPIEFGRHYLFRWVPSAEQSRDTTREGTRRKERKGEDGISRRDTGEPMIDFNFRLLEEINCARPCVLRDKSRPCGCVYIRAILYCHAKCTKWRYMNGQITRAARVKTTIRRLAEAGWTRRLLLVRESASGDAAKCSKSDKRAVSTF